jgi:hypothetical protein
MEPVTRYHVLFTGTEDGYLDMRAQIALYIGTTSSKVVGYIRFHDPGMPFPADSQSGQLIIMHQPSAMFANVLDVLRNEKPIYYYFNPSVGQAFLATTVEPIGEAE